MDEAWNSFRERAHRFDVQQLEQPVAPGGWTRRQMLWHVAAWHVLTTERLTRFRETGDPVEMTEEADAFNARAARGADGRTTGEIVMSLDDSFRRLRREVSRLDDERLAANDGWAAAVVAGNTFEHYEEHLPDLV
jgi:hypothetical protein